LIPAGSRLLELPEVREMVGAFDAGALVYPWKNPRPMVDRLAEEAQEIVAASEKMKRSRTATFERIWRAANRAAGRKTEESAMRFWPRGRRCPISTSPGTVERSRHGPVGPIAKAKEAVRQAETFV